MATTVYSEGPTAHYIANVLLPVGVLNMNETSLAKLNAFKNCPLCNIQGSSVSTGTSTETSSSLPANNPNLTSFGNFFLNLMVNEFNTLFGTDYKPSDFSINSLMNNDQNSLCSYFLVNLNANFSMTCYVELANQIHISMRFDEGDYNVY